MSDLLDSFTWLPSTKENGLHNGGIFKWRPEAARIAIRAPVELLCQHFFKRSCEFFLQLKPFCKTFY